MTPKQQTQITTAYANLMEEVKARIDALNFALTGGMKVASPFVREFCFLQLRMICETIALSCLVAHGDISPKLMKQWSAEKIMQELEKLNPHFYPIATTQEKVGPHSFHLSDKENNFMKKEELLKLYQNCGRVLHRGNIKKIFKNPIPQQYNFPEIFEPAQKISDLLSVHRIHIYDGEWQLLCMLKNRDDNNKVQCALATTAK